MYIKPFKDLKKHNTDIAGGKGASLGEMINNKIPVPDGFVVLSKAFEDFIHDLKIKKTIESILKDIDIDDFNSIEKNSKKIRELILKNEIPEYRQDQILTYFKKLDTKYVAVRSSATAEDGLSKAWAGQLESYLNTTEEYGEIKQERMWALVQTIVPELIELIKPLLPPLPPEMKEE